MEEKSKINPQPGDIATGRVVKSEKRTTSSGDIEIKVKEGAIPEGFDIDNVVPVLVNRAIETVEKMEVIEDPVKVDDVTEEPSIQETSSKNDDKDKKTTIVGYIPVAVIAAALAISIGSCDFKEIHIPDIDNPFEYTRVIERDEIHPFEEEYIEVNGPQDNATGLTGLKGQEGLTNNAMAGEENPIEGEYYSGQEHFKDEKLSATGLDEFKASQAQVRNDMEDLTDENLTQDEKKAKLQSIETETQKMEQQYAEREELMEESVEKFKEATMVNQDSISESESEVAEQIKDIFDQEHERVSDNLEGIQELSDRVETGQQVQIEDVEYDEDTGKYTISGETIEKVVEEQRFMGIQAVWESFKDWVRGDSQKNIDDNQR